MTCCLNYMAAICDPVWMLVFCFHQIKDQAYNCYHFLIAFSYFAGKWKCDIFILFHTGMINQILPFPQLDRTWKHSGHPEIVDWNYFVVMTLECLPCFFRVWQDSSHEILSGTSSLKIRLLAAHWVEAAGCVSLCNSIIQSGSVCVCLKVLTAGICQWMKTNWWPCDWLDWRPGAAWLLHSASGVLHMASLPVYCTVCSAVWHFVCAHLTWMLLPSFLAPWDTFTPCPIVLISNDASFWSTCSSAAKAHCQPFKLTQDLYVKNWKGSNCKLVNINIFIYNLPVILLQKGFHAHHRCYTAWYSTYTIIMM